MLKEYRIGDDGRQVVYDKEVKCAFYEYSHAEIAIHQPTT